jgi:serine/threonine-protein kinase
MEKILGSELFLRSERMSRFLRLAVERTLAGHGNDLKEYVIGIEVFDRKRDYDPRMDPIVRVEARRLRSKLKAYYDNAGRSDEIGIELPAGSYMPRFVPRDAAPQSRPPAVPQAGIQAIAVLPFRDLSAEGEHQYLCDGVTEELIHALTRLPGMRVVAWDSVARLRERQQDIEAVRTRLNVGTALTGSIRLAGCRLRVRAQLIDTATGVYLWSETLDREIQDVFAIQEEIARAIVRTLRVQLAGAGLAPPPRARASFDSYNWYLKGRYLWHHRTRDGLQRSIECFEKALAADPNAALAHTGIADALTLLVDYGFLDPADGIPRARAAAIRAIALDPELAEAHVSLAMIRGEYDHEWEEAEGLYLRAIALNPGYSTAHHWLGGDLYALFGRFDEAMARMDTALVLDPLSSIVHESRAYVMMLSRRFEDALAGYRAILDFDPDFYKAYTSMGRAYAQLGRYADALAMLEKGRSKVGDMPSILGAMGQVCALAGDTGRARGLLAQLEKMAESSYVPCTPLALVHLGLGESQRALDLLETGEARKEPSLCSLRVHPAYDALRGEARFEKILERLKLA